MQKVASSQLLDTFERSQRCTFNQKRCHRPAREKKRENQNQINEGFVWTGDATAQQSNCDMDYNACVVTRNSCWQIWNDLKKKGKKYKFRFSEGISEECILYTEHVQVSTDRL